jgi:hypothetical protein
MSVPSRDGIFDSGVAWARSFAWMNSEKMRVLIPASRRSR